MTTRYNFVIRADSTGVLICQGTKSSYQEAFTSGEEQYKQYCKFGPHTFYIEKVEVLYSSAPEAVCVKAALDRLHDYGVGSPQNDTDELVKAARSELNTLTEVTTGLLSTLSEAAESVTDWGAYADQHFQQKHNLAGDVNRINRAIKDAHCKLGMRVADPADSLRAALRECGRAVGALVGDECSDEFLAKIPEEVKLAFAKRRKSFTFSDVSHWVTAQNDKHFHWVKQVDRNDAIAIAYAALRDFN